MTIDDLQIPDMRFVCSGLFSILLKPKIGLCKLSKFEDKFFLGRKEKVEGIRIGLSIFYLNLKAIGNRIAEKVEGLRIGLSIFYLNLKVVGNRIALCKFVKIVEL